MSKFLKSIKRRIFGQNKKQSQTLAKLLDEIEQSLGQSDLVQAAQHCHSVVTYLQSLAHDQEIPEARKLMGLGYFDLGSFYRQMQRHTDAEAAYSEAVKIFNGLIGDREHGRLAACQLAASMNHLGLLYMESGPSEKAASALEDAIRMRRKLMVQFPDDLENQVYLGGSLCNRAHVAAEADDHTQARVLYDESIAILETAIPPCDCGCRDALAANISQLTGHPHWILLAHSFRRNAENGRLSIMPNSDA